MIAELTPIHETRVGQELIEEGRERGRQEGRQEGWQEGRREELAKLVRRMAAKGRTLSEISEWTELSVEDIERILQSESQ